MSTLSLSCLLSVLLFGRLTEEAHALSLCLISHFEPVKADLRTSEAREADFLEPTSALLLSASAKDDLRTSEERPCQGGCIGQYRNEFIRVYPSLSEIVRA